MFGDLNARSTAWNCLRNNSAGDVLFNLNIRSHFFVYHPNSPTHNPHSGATPSTIDILLSNSSLHISPLTTFEDQLKSDHVPVLYSKLMLTMSTVIRRLFLLTAVLTGSYFKNF